MAFIDPNDFEKVALDTASQLGGALLTQEKIESLPLYAVPIEGWDRQHWMLLVETICAGYVQSLQDQHADATAALRKVTILPPVS